MQRKATHFEVLFVSCEVGEADDLGRPRGDALPRRLLLRVVLRDNDLPVRLETEDLVAGGGGASGLDLVLVPEERDAGFTATVV